MNVSIRVLVAALLGLFSLSLAGILWTQRVATESEIITGMQSILVNVSDGTISRSDSFLLDAQQDARMTAALLTTGNLQSEAALENYFGRLLQNSENASGIFYGTVDGEFLFVDRFDDLAPNGFRTKSITIDQGKRLVALTFRDAEFNSIGNDIDNEDTYNPTERSWFQSALAEAGTVLTDPYVFFSSQQPGVTTAVPVYDQQGEPLGVVGVDIELSELSAFLADLSLGENGTAFIVNGAGEVIALEDQSALRQPDGEGFRLSTVDEVGDPVVSGSFEEVLSKGGVGSDAQFFTLDVAASTEHVFVASIGTSDWLLGVALAEEDFLGDVRRSQRDTSVVAVLIGLVGLFIAWLLIRNVTGPLSVLRRRAADIESGLLSSSDEVDTRITELKETSEAFNHMVAGLQDQQRQNEDLLADMENRVRDRTADLQQRNIERRAAERRAEEASEAKTQFLIKMSHEIRTPLNAIMGLSELTAIQAYGPLGDDRYVEYANDIKGAADHLLELVSELLDLAQVEANELKLSESTFDLVSMTEGVVRMLMQLATDHQIALLTDLPDEPVLLRADERRVKQVLINLINNAIKYTPEGGTARTSVEVSADGQPSMFISDTGSGMTRAQIDIALSPFGRVSDPLDPVQEGTGLGLPITKALVEAHGGLLEISSELGRGTRVGVLLPKDRLCVSELSAG